MADITERIVIPEVPRVLDGQELYVYIPKAAIFDLNIEKGTGNVLVQTTDRDHSFKVMTDGRVKAKSAPIESDDVVRKSELDTKLDKGLIPSQYLPSYVDDVLEYDSKNDFPEPGETGKIYVDTSTNLVYRWSGSTYIQVISVNIVQTTGYSTTDVMSQNAIRRNFLSAEVSNAEIYINNRAQTIIDGSSWEFNVECSFIREIDVRENLRIKDYISIFDQNIADYLKIYFPVQTGTVLLRPNDLPTETSLVTISSTGTHSYKPVSEFVDTTSAQILSGTKTWGTRTGSWYEVAEISNTGILAESGGKNPNIEVSPEVYYQTKLTGQGISRNCKDSGNATEYYSSFMFPIYKEGSQGTYYFSMAPYDNLTADSVIVTGTDRVPVWKPLSEFITGNNFNIGNGTGQGSLIQTNVKSSNNTPYANIASGSGSVSLGKGTKALGNSDFVIGQNTTDDTSGSLVGGINSSNTNNSNYSLVFGDYINNQYAPHSFLFGKDIENSNGNSFLFGIDLVNPAKNAYLIGRGLRSQHYISIDNDSIITILGSYNKRATQGEIDDGTIFIIGNGTSDANRSNAVKLSTAKGLECFTEPITDNGIIRKVELNTKLNKPTNPTEASVVTLTSTGTVGTKKLSEFATSIVTPVTISWSNLKSSEGILDNVRTITTGLYEHSLYLRFIYNNWNAEVFMTLLSNTDAEITDYTGITNILGTTFYHEASGIITSPVGGENEYASGQIQNVSHNGVKVLIPN